VRRRSWERAAASPSDRSSTITRVICCSSLRDGFQPRHLASRQLADPRARCRRRSRSRPASRFDGRPGVMTRGGSHGCELGGRSRRYSQPRAQQAVLRPSSLARLEKRRGGAPECLFLPQTCRSPYPLGSAQLGGKRSLANVAFRLLARRFMHLDTPMIRGVIRSARPRSAAAAPTVARFREAALTASGNPPLPSLIGRLGFRTGGGIDSVGG
jgi:hypothetical protein